MDFASWPSSGGGRPVLLATFDVPFSSAAAELAVDAALEAGQRLIVVNVAELPPLPLSVNLGFDHVTASPATMAAVRQPAELAASLGVAVEHLLVRSPRPVAALLEVVAERRPGLLVLGPDRRVMSRRLYRKAARAVRERAPCLVWLAE
jgi:nucleotide-binding universal stress UspA family protein